MALIFPSFPSEPDRSGTAPTYPAGYCRESGLTVGRGGERGDSDDEGSCREIAAEEVEEEMGAISTAAGGGLERVAAMKGLRRGLGDILLKRCRWRSGVGVGVGENRNASIVGS